MFIFILFHCLSTSDLSFKSFLICKFCSKYFSSSGILFVIVCLFVSSSLLFSALTGWSGSTHYVFLRSPFCLLPLQCCLPGACYLLFFLLMFLPSYCFNNVKFQVLAYSSWLLPICFSCSRSLAALFSLSLPLVVWYLIPADAKLSIISSLRTRIAERKQMQQRNQTLSYHCMYYYFCTNLCLPVTFFTLPFLRCCHSDFTPVLYFCISLALLMVALGIT